MTNLEVMKPAYPEGDVVGPCVCGSWPGGKCLKCPWVGLTEEEVEKIVDDNTQDDQGYDIWCSGKGVARLVEAKLKEKNNGL